ncbi:MAG: hypothetical protein IIC82_07295 [Chloroflexi bacterium]|nr:hypothetical protein [Chloroflexota bacterium]
MASVHIKSAVAIGGDATIAGAVHGEDAVSDYGPAYVFHRNEGGVNNWGEVKKLTAFYASATLFDSETATQKTERKARTREIVSVAQWAAGYNHRQSSPTLSSLTRRGVGSTISASRKRSVLDFTATLDREVSRAQGSKRRRGPPICLWGASRGAWFRADKIVT